MELNGLLIEDDDDEDDDEEPEFDFDVEVESVVDEIDNVDECDELVDVEAGTTLKKYLKGKNNGRVKEVVAFEEADDEDVDEDEVRVTN